jgi:hypothetical protein
MNKNNTENDLGINLKVDHIDHQPNMINEDNTLKKTARLAKLNFIITIVGLGTLGYLHFSSQSSIDDSLAKSKVALKQEIGKDLASKEELQNLSTDLATKMEGHATRISGLELQGERFQEEFGKSAQLSAKINELQASVKKSKPVVADTKSKSKGKPAAKAVKKGKK